MDPDNIPMTPLIHKNTIKKRRSFFVPSDASVLEQNDSEKNSTEIKYIEKIKAEEKQWKQLYEEKREIHKNLLKKLKNDNTQIIDYNTLDLEDIEFLNGSFDIESFVKKSEKLQDMLKIAHLEADYISKRKTMLMNQIEELSIIFETELCDKI